ncbi:5-methyltetrahydropteroyltriglutamate--homocysteine S-methyltransferase [Corynebacterium oculi]|uniref:5-methyltetrahydropteroyltriglutamate--homocysteine S-methyltransferase n=1 Tax=Corynebacterium oculi TaxID=1544416 RepID=A0A0Q1AFZ8_9CORY|nr:5-methyltetrahydropteroyltriglutamate--homocysteine S-methyltransferase [Corynebacterium oculi]KQB85560.1 5-methyltetrahydropteroyltriglutamate--homocysteine methyltransferase [Corynebacterium oculi]
MTRFPSATVLGYPRIGANRELKRALESFWSGRGGNPAETAEELRTVRTQRLVDLGLTEDAGVPEDFSYYDQVLDITIATGALPSRFAPEREVLREQAATPESEEALRAQFTVARGQGDRPALELTKWFDSNYHYLVPEIGPETSFAWLGSLRVATAQRLGDPTRPVLVGPVTFLALAKASEEAPEGYNPLDRLDDLLAVYAQYLAALKEAGAQWVQLDEPALVTDRHRTPQERSALVEALRRAYTALATPEAPQLAVALTYGHAFDAVYALAQTDVQAVIIDVVRGTVPGSEELQRWAGALASKTLGVGVVSGRNIWRADLDEALSTLRTIKEGVGADVNVAVTTSTSLQHVPHDAERETHFDEQLRSWLSFADQKVREVAVLARGLADGDEAITEELVAARAAAASRAAHPGVEKQEVRAATAAVTEEQRTRGDAAERHEAQAAALGLPVLPTTTIGSFPQTDEIRRARAAHRSGKIDDQAYEEAMKKEIAEVIAAQEEIGLDVLVHGEAERNDMVQYFAENFEGFATTAHGWVQSYGSRCTRPSILWGDVTRPQAITVEWSRYAQSLSERPVKGMLTGPVTIMAWSFVREDIPWGEVADQLGLALRAEVGDLEAAGIKVIQVDEPAIRELLPLREEDREEYLEWSVGSFRLATAGAAPATSIHTHLCYSDFATIVDAIDRLDADVTSIEASRSKLKVLPAVAEHGFHRGLGPGVWDIHSARVPSTEEIVELLRVAVGALDPQQVWVNPDCGLKTRGWEETSATLRNLVAATAIVRGDLSN